MKQQENGSWCGTCNENESRNIVIDLMDSLGLKQDITAEYLVRALKCAVLFDKKQHDYGPDNIAQFGDLGVLIRLNDKIQRLKTLMLSGEQPEFTNEAFTDTWMDIHVYGVIGLMCLDGSWPKAYRHMEAIKPKNHEEVKKLIELMLEEEEVVKDANLQNRLAEIRDNL